jgi:uncharacterized membrane protein
MRFGEKDKKVTVFAKKKKIHYIFFALYFSLQKLLFKVVFVSRGFWKTTFQTFLCLFAIRKVGQRKTLFSQRKI